MKEIEIRRYDAAMASEWDAFVDASRNSTFLFKRGFMDYHADRFDDHSLMACDGGKIIALLPANLRREGDRLILQSHGGLTYGGWMLGKRHPDAAGMLEIFGKALEYCRRCGISEIDYKPLPSIYSALPAEEDRYALFRLGARLTECNISVAINLRDNPGFNKQQKRNLKRADGIEVNISESDDVGEFHALLSGCLAERHGVAPVHTASELQLLRHRFPRQIRIFVARTPEGAQAGVCMFDTGRVAHAQYICSTPYGRDHGLLTRLFFHLIESEFADREYFDFGICNERHGLWLNEGLYRQKSSLGGSGVVYERYSLRVTPGGDAV